MNTKHRVTSVNGVLELDALKYTELENQRMKDEISNKDIAIMRLKEELRQLRAKQPKRFHSCQKQNKPSRFYPNRRR